MNIWDIVLIIALVALLGWAFVRTVRRKDSCCGDDCCSCSECGKKK